MFLKAIIEVIAGICAHPEDLKIYDDVSGNHVITLHVYPHQADYPKLVGAQGRTVNAISHLFVRAAVQLKQPLAFMLQESFIGRREDRIPFAYNPDFDLPKLERLFDTVAGTVLPGAEIRQTVNGEDISIVVVTDRTDDHNTTVSALNALFYPYGFAQGRMVNVRLGMKV